jgi:hypothetical protein
MKHQPITVRSPSAVAEKTKKPSRPVARVAENGKLKSLPHGNDEMRLDMIRQTAYSFYLARSCEDGHELDDWLQAEAKVDQMSARPH